MFVIEKDVVVEQRGMRSEMYEAMLALEIGDSFVVPLSMYTAVSVRVRVHELSRAMRNKEKNNKRFRTTKEASGTRVYRANDMKLK